MALTSADYARFQEPKYVGSIDDPEPDTWTHEVESGVIPLTEGEATLGYTDELQLECTWQYENRSSSIVVCGIRARNWPYRGTIDIDRIARRGGSPVCSAIAHAVRRWAPTPQGQAALKASYNAAVEALAQEAAE